jgi:hypothetical protein
MEDGTTIDSDLVALVATGTDEWQEGIPIISSENNFSFLGELLFMNDIPELFLAWDEECCNDPFNIKITISIKSLDDKQVLLPGQIGCEYLDGGGTLIKVGPQTDSEEDAKWDNIPYVGQVLPTTMYGDKFPEYGVEGQIFFIRAENNE